MSFVLCHSSRPPCSPLSSATAIPKIRGKGRIQFPAGFGLTKVSSIQSSSWLIGTEILPEARSRAEASSKDQWRCSSPVCSITTDSAKATKSRTQLIMESIPKGEEAGGAGGTSSYQALQRADLLWEKMRNSGTGTGPPGPAPEVVRRLKGQSSPAGDSSAATDLLDVVVCGGTLGVFIATALVLRGWKVAIVEKGQLRGRKQEWNISRSELMEIVKMGLLDAEEAEEVISIEFNPNRVGFGEGPEFWVKDILNLGVSPAKLIEIVKQRFLSAGGTILEGTGLSKVDVFDDEAVISLDNKQSIRSRLILDVMGNASPIVRQVRWGQHPDGICLVVGSCAQGFENNSTSDVLYSTTQVTEIGNCKAQFFWEAFPSGSGPTNRTTYLFTYIDATPSRPTLEELIEKYWDLMPIYQGVKLEDLKFLQVLHGVFPTYRKSPLPSTFDRVLQVGDASGIQSPLSFGGFGSIARHLERLTDGLSEALEGDILDNKSLSLLNPYMPNLSGAWLLQRAMSVPEGGNPPPNFINELLSTNFKCMEKLGDGVLRPFLQDVVQFGPLAKTMASMMVSNPRILPDIFKQVGNFFPPLPHDLTLTGSISADALQRLEFLIPIRRSLDGFFLSSDPLCSLFSNSPRRIPCAVVDYRVDLSVVLSANATQFVMMFRTSLIQENHRDVFMPLMGTHGLANKSILICVPGCIECLQVGLVPVFDWLIHFIQLGWYTFLAAVIAPRLRGWVNGLDKERQFLWNRRFDAWKFGSGLDYRLK